MALLRAGLLVVLFVVAVAAREGCEAEDEALLQVTQVDTMAGSQVTPKTWTSPRDLAYVPPPQTVKLSRFLNISIYSAVPSFGRDGNFIALLHDGDEHSHTRDLRRHLSENSLFCSDANGTFRSQVQMYGRAKAILLCQWPEKDAQLETYQVRLEDSEGKKLGTIVAQHKPQLLKDYKVAACVRDVFDEQHRQWSGPFKQMVEWLEFSSLHGVDHFFVYTFQGTEAVAEDVLQPYLKSGMATRIHFQDYPANRQKRQLNLANDCLYRAKSHAKWLMPTVDVDEFLHLNLAELFPQTKVPLDYLNTVWDGILLKNHYALNQVSSIYFNKIRFDRAPLDQLDISSTWREQDVERNTKYVANVRQTYEALVHKTMDAGPNAIRLHVLTQFGFFGHYRVKENKVNYNETSLMKHESANIEDPALLSGILGIDGPTHPDSILYKERYEHFASQAQKKTVNAENRFAVLQEKSYSDDAVAMRDFGSDPGLERSKDICIQRKCIDPEQHPFRFLDTHSRLFPKYSPTWDPERAAALRSHEVRDRGHNIINGADNTLTYEVARPWEEVQQQAVARRIAEAAKTATRSQNSHEI